jgi:hypothetical protein
MQSKVVGVVAFSVHIVSLRGESQYNAYTVCVD